ncbi:MAG: FG-GAP repeat protein, partial [Chitinophagales bacterium]
MNNFNKKNLPPNFFLHSLLIMICLSLGSLSNSYAQNFQEIIKAAINDPEAGDLFGYSVSISGDYAIVGAYYEDTGASDAGAAYIFHKDQGGTNNWGEVKKIQASDIQSGDWFGFSVSISGDYAIVGAYHKGNNTGATYIFHKDQGGTDNWGQVKKIQASDIQGGDNFGRSVSISGDYAIVGAPLEDTGGLDAGAAYIFHKDQGGSNNWGEVKKIQASDKETGDWFGESVSISGDYAIVGASSEGIGASHAGAAYVFHKDEGGTDNWGEVQKIQASDPEEDDNFGVSVSISNGSVIIGAWMEDTGGIDAGAAYIFQTDQSDQSDESVWLVADIITDCDSDGATYDVCYTAADLASVIGVDLKFSYPDELTPAATDFVTLKDLALNAVGGDDSMIDVQTNTDIAGEVQASVYFNTNALATAAWSGDGEFICFSFELSSTWDGTPLTETIVTNELLESFQTSVSMRGVEDATLKIITMIGQINVNGDTATPLVNGSAFNGTTEITTAEENCTPDERWTQGLNTATDGGFSIPAGGSANLRITRNTSAIDLSVIGGPDALRAVFIRLGMGDAPTLNELLAMDVNGDGFASAGDITNILRRSVGLIADYPTQAGEVASDWKFALSDDMDVLEGGTYDWKTVPVLSQCMAVPADACADTVQYDAILKGDVVSSWSATSNFKTTAETSLVVDVASKHSLELEETYRIPVFAQDIESFFTLDLDLPFDPSKVSIQDVVLTEIGESYDIQ